jgi:CheY-like chemotaxis protein
MKNITRKDKLLIIDDDAATQILFTEIFDNTRFQVLNSENGYKALEFLNKYTNSISLIFLDIRLPDYNGFHLLAKIRELSNDIPVISMTAAVTFSIKEQCKMAGFNANIFKPFDINKIVEFASLYG